MEERENLIRRERIVLQGWMKIWEVMQIMMASVTQRHF